MIQEDLGATTSGVSAPDTTAALARAMQTWNNNTALEKVDLVRRADDGADNTFFDLFVGGTAGFPFAADIVTAGWWPLDFFEAVGGPGGCDGIVAFSVTFVFTGGPDNTPTDISGDDDLDTAFNEVYFNDTFGDPAGVRGDAPWGIDIAGRADGIDVETVAPHDLGHALGIGHFGPKPIALMHPRYSGEQQPGPTDVAGMHSVRSSWPK